MSKNENSNASRIFNFRSLSGYECKNGVILVNKLFRSAQFYNLTNDDKLILEREGIHNIIDLRTINEIKQFPNMFEEVSEFNIMNMPSPGHAKKNDYKMMGELYIDKIENLGSYYVDLIRVISKLEGGTIIQCFAGKDRTGIIVSLILELLGVNRENILLDYELSEIELKHLFKKYLKVNPEIELYTLSSDRKNLSKMLEHIDTKYNGVFKYLKGYGFNEEDLKTLTLNFVKRT